MWGESGHRGDELSLSGQVGWCSDIRSEALTGAAPGFYIGRLPNEGAEEPRKEVPVPRRRLAHADRGVGLNPTGTPAAGARTLSLPGRPADGPPVEALPRGAPWKGPSATPASPAARARGRRCATAAQRGLLGELRARRCPRQADPDTLGIRRPWRGQIPTVAGWPEVCVQYADNVYRRVGRMRWGATHRGSSGGTNQRNCVPPQLVAAGPKLRAPARGTAAGRVVSTWLGTAVHARPARP